MSYPEPDDTTGRVVRRVFWMLVAVVVIASLPILLTRLGSGAAGFGTSGLEATTHRGAPTAEVAALAQSTAMTPLAQQLFYDAQPSIESGSTFTQHCSPENGQTGSLGCFTGANIYIFAVGDPELGGTEEVTAAHEMLHAAWQQTSQADRDALRPALLAAYDAAKSDPDVESDVQWEMKNYGVTTVDNPDMLNELHSILGTIALPIGQQLETHYALYFSDRGAVLACEASSQARFTALDSEITGFSTQIGTIDAQIAAAQANITQANDAYNRAVADYNSWAFANPVAPIATINAKHDELSRLVEALNTAGSAVAPLLDQRNAISAQWSADSAEWDRLDAELDSTASGAVGTPAPAGGAG